MGLASGPHSGGAGLLRRNQQLSAGPRCSWPRVGTWAVRVFPDAPFKFFLDASIEVRAKRRYEQLRAMDMEEDLERIQAQIRIRDDQDRNRRGSAQARRGRGHRRRRCHQRRWRAADHGGYFGEAVLISSQSTSISARERRSSSRPCLPGQVFHLLEPIQEFGVGHGQGRVGLDVHAGRIPPAKTGNPRNSSSAAEASPPVRAVCNSFHSSLSLASGRHPWPR